MGDEGFSHAARVRVSDRRGSKCLGRGLLLHPQFALISIQGRAPLPVCKGRDGGRKARVQQSQVTPREGSVDPSLEADPRAKQLPNPRLKETT